jgi:hypothetical protein
MAGDGHRDAHRSHAEDIARWTTSRRRVPALAKQSGRTSSRHASDVPGVRLSRITQERTTQRLRRHVWQVGLGVEAVTQFNMPPHPRRQIYYASAGPALGLAAMRQAAGCRLPAENPGSIGAEAATWL